MSPLDAIRRHHAELTAFRRDLHAHPELGMAEHRTAEKVAEALEALGIEVHRGVGGTGVVGVLRNGRGNRAIGLRADMDALPLQELNDVPYRSTIPGAMHACGHDGHTTMLLGAARYLAETRNFDGIVHFIFQPGEEGCGGALAMLEDRLFERFPCDAIYAMHNVIPETAVISGTARFFSRSVSAQIEEGLKRVAEGVAAGFGATATLDYRLIFAPTVNQPEQAEDFAAAMAELVGEENIVRDAPPGMGSEDFAFMMERVPGAYVHVGNGDGAMPHNPRYQFNDAAIPYGSALFARLVERGLRREA
jgi:metal-dependent amidase/aminoacylase/carboxypeptidase family protein